MAADAVRVPVRAPEDAVRVPDGAVRVPDDAVRVPDVSDRRIVPPPPDREAVPVRDEDVFLWDELAKTQPPVDDYA